MATLGTGADSSMLEEIPEDLDAEGAVIQDILPFFMTFCFHYISFHLELSSVTISIL